MNNKRNKYSKRDFENAIFIDRRTEQIFNLRVTDTLLLTSPCDKVSLPKALVTVDRNGEIITYVIKVYNMPKS